MAKQLPDYPCFDFSGGIRRDKSPYQLKDNELQSGRNFEIDETGRIRKRRGHQAFGDLASSFNKIGIFLYGTGGSTVISTFAVDNSSNLYILNPTNLATAITAGQITGFDVDASGGYPTNGTVEIEGDVITYTGKTGNTLGSTSISGATSAHAIGVPVHAWIAGSGVTSTNLGSDFAIFNNILFLNSAGVYYNADHTAAVFSTASGSPSVLFITLYKSRLYGAGTSAESSPSTRIFYSNLGDGTVWTPASDYFEVEDDRNEPVTALKDYANVLQIFKINSMYQYNLASLKQTNRQVGAYNNSVVQEINKLLYTFCPAGIFISNGYSAVNIGEPVKEYWKNFQATFGSTYKRVVINCSGGRFGKYYLLYIGDITLDDGTSLSDVVLSYDTLKKNWTIHTGFTDLINFIPVEMFEDNEDQIQYRPRLYFTSTSLGAYVAFENRTLDGTTVQGGDILSDMFKDTGTPITMNVVTKSFTLKTPHIRKQFRYLKTFSEVAGIQVSYKIDKQSWKPLGKTSGDVDRFEFPSDAVGRRCAIALDESSTNPSVVFNGLIFEDTVALDKNV